ncbi:unnamed protein product [Sphagnum balticum]
MFGILVELIGALGIVGAGVEFGLAVIGEGFGNALVGCGVGDSPQYEFDRFYDLVHYDLAHIVLILIAHCALRFVSKRRRLLSGVFRILGVVVEGFVELIVCSVDSPGDGPLVDDEYAHVAEAAVEGEDGHQQHQVSDGVDVGEEGARGLTDDEPQREGEEEAAVTDVSEHDSEEEGEDGDGEDAGIYLLVSRHPVDVYQLLEGGGEGVDLEVSWRVALSFGLPHTYEGWDDIVEKSLLARGDPYPGYHCIEFFFQ